MSIELKREEAICVIQKYGQGTYQVFETHIDVQDYKDAIVIQDACNISGVLLSFSKIILKLNQEMFFQKYDFKWRDHHPLIILFLDKLASLAGGRTEWDYHFAPGYPADFHAAYMFANAKVALAAR
jgi:hypothetical protein